jgi:hypothetical protein
MPFLLGLSAKRRLTLMSRHCWSNLRAGREADVSCSQASRFA